MRGQRKAIQGLAKGEYFDDLLKAHFHFYMAVDYEEFCKDIRRLYALDVSFDIAAGMTLGLQSEGSLIVVIWIEPKDSIVEAIPVIAHECVHAANLAFERAGYDPKTYNDEMQAYYVGHLASKCSNFWPGNISKKKLTPQRRIPSDKPRAKKS